MLVGVPMIELDHLAGAPRPAVTGLHLEPTLPVAVPRA